jgi:hypothetical protein
MKYVCPLCTQPFVFEHEDHNMTDGLYFHTGSNNTSEFVHQDLLHISTYRIYEEPTSRDITCVQSARLEKMFDIMLSSYTTGLLDSH